VKLASEANHHSLLTVELIPDRVVTSDLSLIRGRVDGITIPALRNGSQDPSYPVNFHVTPQQRSIASAVIVRKTGIESVPSLTCRDFRKSDLATIPALFEKGLENFLVVFGDPFPGSFAKKYDFKKTEELIRGVLSVFDGRRPCIGAVTNQYAEDGEREIARTLRKVDAGAEYVITNVAFDDEVVLEHIDHLRSHGLNVPLFVQVSIPSSLENVLYVSHKFGIPIPPQVRETLAKKPIDGGVQVAARAYEVLHGKADGIHFSYLLRSRNPIPHYRHLLDALGVQRSGMTIPVEASVRSHSVP